MGARRDITVLILARNEVGLLKGVDDTNPINDLSMLHIFGEYLLAAGSPGAMHDQRIPVREIAEPMDIDCR